MGIGSTGAGDANVGNTYGTSGQNPAIGGGGTAPGYGGFQGGNNPYNIPANLLGRMSQSDIMQFNNMMAAQGGAQPASMGSTNAPQYYYQPQPGADTISRTPDQLNQGTQDYNILNPNELMNRQNGTGGYPTGSRDAITQAMLGNGYYGGG
jgi:hypothetical protein